MKKILGIVAVVLLVGAPAFAAAPYIHYFLQLGGDNHAADYKSGPPKVFTPGLEADGYDATGKTVITWSVRVDVGGVKAGQGGDMLVGGAANLVFDLRLLDSQGNLVANFGLGDKVSKAGYFSTINDGTANGVGGTDPIEAAAFTNVFQPSTLNDIPARIFDKLVDGGPHMSRYQYPSVQGWPNNAPGQRPGVSQAVSGTLMGQGAGYEQYNANIFSGTERGGVGISDPAAQNQCAWLQNLPLFEGQLNLTGLGGTYTLELVPGKGNNVLWNALADCTSLEGGAFAIGVANEQGQTCPAANLCGDTITFTLPIPGVKPKLVSAVSRRVHGAAGTFDIALPLTAGANAGVECRQGGPTQLVLSYDANIGGTPAVVLSAGTLGAVSISGKDLIVNLSGVPNASCLSVGVTGVKDAATGAQTADPATIKVASLFCDVNGNRSVNAADIGLLKLQSGQPVTAANFKMDVNANGSINAADIGQCKLQSGQTAPACAN